MHSLHVYEDYNEHNPSSTQLERTKNVRHSLLGKVEAAPSSNAGTHMASSLHSMITNLYTYVSEACLRSHAHMLSFSDANDADKSGHHVL